MRVKKLYYINYPLQTGNYCENMHTVIVHYFLTKEDKKKTALRDFQKFLNIHFKIHRNIFGNVSFYLHDICQLTFMYFQRNYQANPTHTCGCHVITFQTLRLCARAPSCMKCLH